MLPSSQAGRDDWKCSLASRFHHLKISEKNDTWILKGPWTDIIGAQNCLEFWYTKCTDEVDPSKIHLSQSEESQACSNVQIFHSTPDITKKSGKHYIRTNSNDVNGGIVDTETKELHKEGKHSKQTDSAESDNAPADPDQSSSAYLVLPSASSSRHFESVTTGDLRENNSTTQNGHTSPLFSCPMVNGTNIYLYVADITKLRVGAIVNAANEMLRHGGGVAGAISRAAGPSFQQESDAHVRRYGKVPLSNAVLQQAGPRLPCKHVIHAVGPMWITFTNKEKCKNILTSTFLNVFKCASLDCKVSSVAVPPISSGTKLISSKCIHGK